MQLLISETDEHIFVCVSFSCQPPLDVITNVPNSCSRINSSTLLLRQYNGSKN